MGVREQFYGQLRMEFDNGRNKSFLYRYLKQERKAHPKEDDYARLERCYALLKKGETGQRDYLILALQVLIKNGRLRPIRAGDILLAYGRALGGEDFFRGLRRDRDKYAALQKVLEAGKPALSMPPEAVTEIHGDLLDAMLRRDAQTYLYDAGRKKDRDMAMLDAYCDKKGLVLAPGGKNHGSAPLTRQELDQWEALFRALWRERRRDVLIPIRIDPRTGAGLFIAGSAHCPKELRGDRKDPCYYVCSYPCKLQKEDGDTYLFSRFFTAEPEDLKDPRGMLPFPSLDEAQKWYFQKLRAKKDDDLFRLLYLRRNNKAPRGCPEELLWYFMTPSNDFDDRDEDDDWDEDMESLSKKGQDALLADMEVH